MSRTAHGTIRKLIDARQAGGYTLPAAVTTAAAAVDALEAINLEPPAIPDQARIAAELLAAAAAGQPVDVVTAARPILDGTRQAADHDTAWRLLFAATERARTDLSAAVAELSELVIAEHLAPAHAETLAQAEEHAAALDGFDLTPAALITAPAKARNAYAALVELERRRQVLRQAREWVVACSAVRPQYDEAGEFVGVRYPRRLFPGLADTQPTPRQWQIPTEPVETILWYVRTAKPAEPWLPTVTEQDAAWWETYGEAVDRIRRNNHDLGAYRALGGVA